jgi:hypothetical protein
MRLLGGIAMKVINEHLAEKQTLEFCQFLMVRQPLAQEITLQLQVPALANIRGTPIVFGVYDYTHRRIVVSVYCQAIKPARFLRTIAHEYRHAQQVFEGTIKIDRRVAGFVRDGAAEADADDFAWRSVKEFYAEVSTKSELESARSSAAPLESPLP